MSKKLILANIFKNIARYALFLLGILIFVFALLSGSEGNGEGFMGIVKNSPNALPWLLLLALVGIAWKWELIGGIIITCLGLFFVYYFNFQGPNFNVVVLIMTSLIAVLGSFFIVSWYLKRNNILEEK